MFVQFHPDSSNFDNSTDVKGEEAKEEIRQKLVGEHGDRHQELVFIGRGMDQHKIETLLDDCLLTDEEYDCGPANWVDFDDPLPPIELEVGEDDATEGLR